MRVDGLPPSARVHGLHGWTPADQHAALTAELTHATYRVLLLANGVPKSKVPAPLIIVRPWDKPKPKKAWIREWAAAATGRRG